MESSDMSNHQTSSSSFTLVMFVLLPSLYSMKYANSMHQARSISGVSEEFTEVKGALAESLAAGAELAMATCKEQFKWDRWNCPSSSFSRRETRPVTKEMAFVSAVTAAGLVYGVARACSRGAGSCGCRASSWAWAGCPADHFSAGYRAAHLFLSALEHGSADLNTQTNLHNYKLGQNVVGEHMRKECKCHGVSGSCSTQSCWRRAGGFSEVGRALRRRYDRALRVDSNSANRHSAPSIPENRMIFLADSPDYCKPNTTAGWDGTAGRICSRNSGGSKAEKRSCREVCRACGHQVRRRPTIRQRHCNCSFHWCCNVICSQCHDTTYEFYCDASPLLYAITN